MELPKVQGMDKEASSLCKVEGVGLQGRQVERVGNPSQKAVLDSPRASFNEGRGAHLVPQVWQVHSQVFEGAEGLVHREASQLYQAEEVAARQASC